MNDEAHHIQRFIHCGSSTLEKVYAGLSFLYIEFDVALCSLVGSKIIINTPKTSNDRQGRHNPPSIYRAKFRLLHPSFV